MYPILIGKFNLKVTSLRRTLTPANFSKHALLLVMFDLTPAPYLAGRGVGRPYANTTRSKR